MPKVVFSDSSGTEQTVELSAEPALIGCATEAQIQTQDGLVSRRHAHIVVKDGIYWIEDLGSSNGVYVNGQKVQSSQLRPGDEMVCGSLTMRFLPDVAAAIRRTQGMAAFAEPPSAQSQPAPVRPRIKTPVLTPAPPPAIAPPPLAPPVSVASLPSDFDSAEISSERRRRMDAEFERDEALRKIDELKAQLEQAKSRSVPAAGGPDTEAELVRLRRRNDQLESELKRQRGGGGAAAASGDGAALRLAEAERDKLRVRLAELEDKLNQAQVASPSVGGNEDAQRLQRKVDQLQSELKRLRTGGPAAPAGADDGRVAELEEKVRQLTQERDEARRPLVMRPESSMMTPAGRFTEELSRAKQEIDRLEAALRQLRDVERERDALRSMVAAGAGSTMSTLSAKPEKAPLPPRVAECLSSVGDGLADIRAALRAAGDDLALEQLEQLREKLREAQTLLSAR